MVLEYSKDDVGQCQLLHIRNGRPLAEIRLLSGSFVADKTTAKYRELYCDQS